MLTARGGATRQRLIDAARAELLDTDGALEVAKVAARAAASPGLLYRYFGAKDGLVAAVVHGFYDSYDEAVFAVAAPSEPGWAERERERLSREIDFLCDDPLARIIVGRRLRETSAAQADAERLATQIDMAAKNVVHAQRTGEVDPAVDARLVSAAFLGAFRELMAEAMSREVLPARQDLLDTIWRLGSSIIPVA
ncbi:TetR/AcrR family transcriptional regulator [Nocardia sp. SYP-A9097]|uniref:TetR/AcrR family transcriptional regulator n=1 Tax=Nocardia sp. SYP-A9097 TaxID=2663237 RepID=UPI001891A876|nr:TetR/AcrR family transcriptional regulator [Nocardia sp. SYP-A9097]